MSESHLVSGVSLLSFGAATVSYLTYKVLERRKNSLIRNNDDPSFIFLSETIAGIFIGILQIVCYQYCTQCQDINANGTNYSVSRQNDEDYCEEAIDCVNWQMLFDQIVFTATAVHCFVSLITSSALCNFCETTELKTIFFMALQWIVPIVNCVILYYVMDNSSEMKLSYCDHNKTQSNNFQALVSEILEQPVTITTEKSIHFSEISNIIGKVYGIVGNATKHTEIIQDTTVLDEGFQIYNILERLKTQNNRMPKQLNIFLDNQTYKIYSVLFILFVFIAPLIYSNSTYTQLKMIFALNEIPEERKINLADKMKYLKVSMLSAAVLWTPSCAEMFSRAYLMTQSESKNLMHIFLTLGSTYMLVRNGMNLKLLKAFGQNSVNPKI